MSQVAIFPGSFDPVTFGHIDLIKRAAAIFDEVIVAIAGNMQKDPLFTVEERLDMLKQATKGIASIRCEVFEGLVIDFAVANKANVLVRGLRMISDFEYELQMALTNRRLSEEIETVFLMPSENFSFLSSTLIKEAASLGANLKSFVPDFVEEELKKKLQKQ